MFGSDNQGLTIVIKAIDNATSVLKKVDDSVRSTTSNFSQAQTASKGFATALAGVATGLGATALFALKSASETQKLRSAFDVLTGSAQKGEEIFTRISKMAATTPFETTDIADAAKTMLSFGIESNKVMEYLRMLGDVSLGNKTKLAGLSLAFSQVQSTGRLMGQDLLQMINQGFNPLTIIAQKTGKSMASLKKEMEQGSISAEMVADAFKTATSQGGLFYQGMEKGAQTLEGRLSTLSDEFKSLLRNIVGISENGEVISGGLFDRVSKAILALTKVIQDNKDNILTFFHALTSEEFKKGLTILGGMIMGALVPAFYALGASIVAASLPLLPWIALGGAVILMLHNLNEIVKAFSEDSTLIWQGYKIMIGEVWDGILNKLTKSWEFIKSMFTGGANFLIGLAEGWANSWVDAVNIIIKALNKISFSIPDWVPGVGGKSFGINIDLAEKFKLPRFEQGGIVPGAVGQAVPIMAHGQERVIPASMASSLDGGNGPVFNIVINNPVIRNQGDVNIMRQQIDQALRDLIRVHKLQTI